jgi:Zn-dependent alcohol dehydrogenase
MSIEVTVFKGSANGGIVESTTRRDGPTGSQVLVKITHSGICGTDEHFMHADMGLRHEGVGTVEQIGELVSQFQVSDVVGWGYMHKTCGECEQCLSGTDEKAFHFIADLLYRSRSILLEERTLRDEQPSPGFLWLARHLGHVLSLQGS